MRKLTKYEALLFTVVGPAFFWILAIFVDPILLKNLFDSLALGVFILVAYVWFWPMMEELRSRGRESDAGGWVIVLGVFYWAFTLAWQRVYAIAAVYLNRPHWMIYGTLAAFIPFSLMWGGFLFLLAPGMTSHSIHADRKGLIYVIIAVFIGGAAAGFAGAQVVPIE